MINITLKIAVLIVAALTFAACGSDQMSNEDYIAEVAQCEANGYKARTLTSTWDGDRTGVECYTSTSQRLSESLTVIEHTLDDGTRCVIFKTAGGGYRAGFSGASCDWEKSE